MQTLLYAAKPKGLAAERLVAELREADQRDTYMKHGVVFERRKNSVECIGQYYRVRNKIGGVRIVE